MKTHEASAPVADLDGPALYESMRSAFARACTADPSATVESDLVMGGRPVRLTTAGHRLEQYVGRPLAHLATAASNASPSLSIELWDEGDTGEGCAGFEIRDELGVDGEVTTSADGRYVGYRRARSFTLYDRRAGRMLGWSNYGERACLYEQGRPLHMPLSIWHCDAGLQVMHSGLVAYEGAGVLFPGMGGSGKSTSSLTCLEAGLQYLGDDYIALSEDEDGTCRGHSLYNSSHLEPHHLQRFEHLRDYAIEATMEQEDKWLILLNDVFPGSFLTSAPIRAIAMPRVVDAETTTYRPASKGQAMLALAPSSLVMIPGRGAAGMDRLAALVDNVPCYWLELGRDLASTPRAVISLLQELRIA